MRRFCVLLCTLLVCAACSEPPQKEMNRAQGAIDAARAAGAERYAPEAFAAATTALQQSHDAVEQRDYRMALSRALDASDRAQDAAKQAGDNKAKARSDSETAVNATTAALRELESQLKSAAAAHLPAPTVAQPRKVATDAAATLQKARAALRAGNYLEASAALKNTRTEIMEQIRELDSVIDARGGRGGKKKR
jgi:hypothetical protein